MKKENNDVAGGFFFFLGLLCFFAVLAQDCGDRSWRNPSTYEEVEYDYPF